MPAKKKRKILASAGTRDPNSPATYGYLKQLYPNVPRTTMQRILKNPQKLSRKQQKGSSRSVGGAVRYPPLIDVFIHRGGGVVRRNNVSAAVKCLESNGGAFKKEVAKIRRQFRVKVVHELAVMVAKDILAAARVPFTNIVALSVAVRRFLRSKVGKKVIRS